MKIVLLCDANAVVGTGHVTRCYALAQALSDRGATPWILGEANGPTWLETLVEAFRIPEATTENRDTALIVIDSYESAVYERADKLFPGIPQVHIVDDSSPSRPSAGYIEPGVNTSWKPPPGLSNAERISGPSAVLIRSELRSSALRPSDIPDRQPLRVAISLGGSDGYGIRELLVDALVATQLPMHLMVVAPHPLDVALGHDQTVIFLEPGVAIQELVVNTDIVISAAGVSAWEFLHNGLPTALICAVENQAANYEYMTREGAAVGLGRTYAGEQIDLAPIKELMLNDRVRREVGRKAAGLVDGAGADRAADMIISLVGQ
jgi:spore coat polysaccharide biosynthesis predicted glycosyltransferase SpsG